MFGKGEMVARRAGRFALDLPEHGVFHSVYFVEQMMSSLLCAAWAMALCRFVSAASYIRQSVVETVLNFVPDAYLRHWEEVFEHDGELRSDSVPFAHRALPLGRCSIECQIDQFRRGLVAWKVAARAYGSTDF